MVSKDDIYFKLCNIEEILAKIAAGKTDGIITYESPLLLSNELAELMRNFYGPGRTVLPTYRQFCDDLETAGKATRGYCVIDVHPDLSDDYCGIIRSLYKEFYGKNPPKILDPVNIKAFKEDLKEAYVILKLMNRRE